MSIFDSMSGQTRARSYNVKVVVSVFLLFASVAILAAGSVTLGWCPNSEPDVAGYKIYYGPASRNYTNVIDVLNVNEYRVTGLVSNGTYYFAVTAYATNGLESDYSCEVCINCPPLPDCGPPCPRRLKSPTLNRYEKAALLPDTRRLGLPRRDRYALLGWQHGQQHHQLHALRRSGQRTV